MLFIRGKSVLMILLLIAAAVLPARLRLLGDPFPKTTDLEVNAVLYSDAVTPLKCGVFLYDLANIES
jgi:hypothetical protein